MKTQRVLITPEVAARLLARNDTNRPVRRTRVAEMALDMTLGRWQETHQGIALNCDGSLRDGQHRLMALIESGTSQWFLVTTGLSDEAMEVIDSGGIRTVADGFAIRGEEITHHHVAVARQMMQRGRNLRRSVPRLDLIAFCRRHHDAILFASHPTRVRKISHASIVAPVARAWYTEDHERLQEFVACLHRAVVTCEADTAATALLRHLAASGERLAGGKEYRAILYRKVCAALVAFLEHRPLSRLYERDIEPFPIPDDWNPYRELDPGEEDH